MNLSSLSLHSEPNILSNLLLVQVSNIDLEPQPKLLRCLTLFEFLLAQALVTCKHRFCHAAGLLLHKSSMSRQGEILFQVSSSRAGC